MRAVLPSSLVRQQQREEQQRRDATRRAHTRKQVEKLRQEYAKDEQRRQAKAEKKRQKRRMREKAEQQKKKRQSKSETKLKKNQGAPAVTNLEGSLKGYLEVSFQSRSGVLLEPLHTKFCAGCNIGFASMDLYASVSSLLLSSRT